MDPLSEGVKRGTRTPYSQPISAASHVVYRMNYMLATRNEPIKNVALKDRECADGVSTQELRCKANDPRLVVMYRSFMVTHSLPTVALRALAACLCLTAVSLPLSAQQAMQAMPLIPQPREIRPGQQIPLLHGIRIVCTACGSDAEAQFTLDDLTRTLTARGIPVSSTGGTTVQLNRTASLSAMPPEAQAEGYSIEPGGGGLVLTAASEAGLFYAAQTVKQMVEDEVAPSASHTGTPAMLQLATIRDWPAMRYRGLSDDLSRGPVPTLAFQKHLIQVLAAYKANLYKPYFENTQQYISNPLAAPPGGSMSPGDARELSAFAARYHIMVVPEQEAFGHLRHTLVWEQYQPLAETPHGAVLAPGQPGSIELIKQWFGELAKDYPDSPFLHIGADETVDLGVGQTKAEVDSRGLAPVYLDFLQQIATALQPLHRKLLFWGDIAQNSPGLLKTLPQSFKNEVIAIAWGYEPNPKGFDSQITPFRNAGMETWVAPGINNWSRVYPNYNYGLVNIQQFTRDGQRLGADGQLNTLWNDDGEALASNNYYGILFGAAAAWQSGESSIPAFQQAYGSVFHGDQTGLLDQAQEEMMAAHALLHEDFKSSDGSDLLFWVDPWSPDGQKLDAKIRPYTHDLRLHAERALTLIAQARAATPPTAASDRREADKASGYDPAHAFPSDPTGLRETDAIDALELGARRMDFIGLKFQLADEMVEGYGRALTASTSSDRKIHSTVNRELSDINGVNGRIQDIKDTLSLLRDLYQQSWLRTNRAYALRPVLEHYDYTIGIWLSRMDKVRSAQRQYSSSRSLPSPSALDMPASLPQTTTP
jgi:hexosaminidase